MEKKAKLGNVGKIQGKYYKLVRSTETAGRMEIGCNECAFGGNCNNIPMPPEIACCNVEVVIGHAILKEISKEEWLRCCQEEKTTEKVGEREVHVEVPKGFEIDKEHSTFTCIKFKKKLIKSWQDYEDQHGMPYELARLVGLLQPGKTDTGGFKARSEFENFLKHVIAEYKIKLLLPFYGGEITGEEWGNGSMLKYTIYFYPIAGPATGPFPGANCTTRTFVTFHTEEQRDDFLTNNQDLLQDYFKY